MRALPEVRINTPIDAPPQRWKLVRAVLPKRFQPYLRGARKQLSRGWRRLPEPYRTVYTHTQAHPVRQENLVRIAGLVEAAGLPGAVVECGVLDGGTAALLAHATRGSGRPVHLFDAWEGLPRTVPLDGAGSRQWEGQVVGSPRRVAAVIRALGVDEARVEYHIGWFSDTFTHAAPQIGSACLVHLDADFYEPTRLALETWFPRLVRGGYLQLDDYSEFEGCRRATNDFLDAHPRIQLNAYGDGPARAYYFRKD